MNYNYKQSQINDIIQLIAQGLSTEAKRKQFKEKGLFDMEDVEEFQQEVYRVAMDRFS